VEGFIEQTIIILISFVRDVNIKKNRSSSQSSYEIGDGERRFNFISQILIKCVNVLKYGIIGIGLKRNGKRNYRRVNKK